VSQPSSARYQRSFGGLVVALLVVLAFAVVVVGYRALGRDQKVTPVPTVDYSAWVRSGRADGKLAVFVPHPRPSGWRATSAQYTTGDAPHWHLGLLTDSGRYVGVEESLSPVDDVVSQYVSGNALPGRSVSLEGTRWRSWRGDRGDYALVRRLPAPSGKRSETLLVVGSDTPAAIRSFAASLRAG
jgi:Protein of unknown function (DUF4245)